MAGPTIYRVMLSSTFRDLVDQRADAEREFRRKDFHAVWMEDDSALSGADLIDASLAKVEAADAYFCIIGQRYGQVHDCPTRNPDRRSLTELEFERALKRGIPVSVLIMGDSYPMTARDVEFDAVLRAKLLAFRERARSDKRVVDVFESREAFLKAMPKVVDEMRSTVDRVLAAVGGVGVAESLADAIAARVAATLSGQVGAEARRRGLSDEQMQTVLRRFGHEGMPQDQWEETLLKSADRLRELEDRLKTLSNEEPEIAILLRQAGMAVEKADFEGADGLLADAESRDLERGQERIKRAARTREQRGDLAMSSGRHMEAADHYAAAAEIVVQVDRAKWARLRCEEARAAYERGMFDLDPLHLHRSVGSYRAALAVRTKEYDPDLWALTQNNMGLALNRLGERGDDEALAQAVAAFRSALAIYERQHRPADWAMTQNNLGNALLILGGRGHPDALSEAAKGFRAVLEIYTRESAPTDWAMAQNNLAGVLVLLGRQGDDQALADANAAYRSALEVYTKEDTPTNWATIQNNRGAALIVLGRKGDKKALLDSIEAYRLALQVRTPERTPSDWAATQNNLANALQQLGDEGDVQALAEAVESYRLALEVYTRERAPAYWAMTQNNLGCALKSIGQNGDQKALLEAVKSFRLALEIRARERAPADWAMTQYNLADALGELAKSDASWIGEAIKSAKLALEGYEQVQYQPDIRDAHELLEQLEARAREGSA